MRWIDPRGTRERVTAIVRWSEHPVYGQIVRERKIKRSTHAHVSTCSVSGVEPRLQVPPRGHSCWNTSPMILPLSLSLGRPANSLVAQSRRGLPTRIEIAAPRIPSPWSTRRSIPGNLSSLLFYLAWQIDRGDRDRGVCGTPTESNDPIKFLLSNETSGNRVT